MGNADALGGGDLTLSSLLALLNVAVFCLFFHSFQFASFDRGAAVSIGLPCGRLDMVLLLLTAFSCVGAFRAVGVLVVVSFLVGPFLIARLFSHKLKVLLILSPAIGIFASLLGVALARHFLTFYDLALSTGGIVALLIAVFYLLSQVFFKFRREKRVTV